MSDPLSPERTGDLSELGLQPHPTTPFDEMAAMEEEAQATTAAEPTIPEPEAPQAEEPEAQVQTEAEPVEEAQEESILQAILKQKEQESKPSETSILQENARLKGLLDGRLQAVEEQIKQRTAPVEEPKPDVQESLIDSAPVRQVLAHLKEEDPAEYEAALVRVAKEEAVREMQAKYEALEQRFVQDEQQKQKQQEAMTSLQVINHALVDIERKGGLEAELIQQLRADPQHSYLGAKFGQSPGILASKEGIQKAVEDVAAQLKSQYEAQQSRAVQVSPTVEASAGGGNPSTRGVSLGEKPKQMSEEDQIVANMMAAGNRTKALDFFDD